MLAAFEGWNDAGEAASDALRYLNKLWGGKKVGSIDADEYYDFQFTRPTIRRTASGERKIKWPSTRIFKASAPGLQRGRHLRPGHRAVLQVAGLHRRAAGPCRGAPRGLRDPGGCPAGRRAAQPADPGEHVHGRRCAAGADEPGGVAVRGPGGDRRRPAEVALLAGLPTVSLWAAVPHYVAQAPSPKAQLALLHRIEELLQVPLDTHELAEEVGRLGARRGRAGHRGPGNRGVRPPAGGGQGHRRPSRRPAASRSPGNSSATSSAGARTSPSRRVRRRSQRRRPEQFDAEQRVDGVAHQRRVRG